jgi:hypothetical protein
VCQQHNVCVEGDINPEFPPTAQSSENQKVLGIMDPVLLARMVPLAVQKSSRDSCHGHRARCPYVSRLVQ